MKLHEDNLLLSKAEYIHTCIKGTFPSKHARNCSFRVQKCVCLRYKLKQIFPHTNFNSFYLLGFFNEHKGRQGAQLKSIFPRNVGRCEAICL